MEKEGASIPSPLTTFAHTASRDTVKRESVQPVKAARPNKNTQIFTPDPMAHTPER